MSGLFARHRKPAGIRIKIVIFLGDLRQCQNRHYTFHFYHVSVLFSCGFVVSGYRVSETGSISHAWFGRKSWLPCALGVGSCTRPSWFGSRGFGLFHAPHTWKPTRARTYATTFSPFLCLKIHSCKVVPHFCEINVCRRKVVESFEAR